MGQGCSCADSNDKEQEVRTDPVFITHIPINPVLSLETAESCRKVKLEFRRPSCRLLSISWKREPAGGERLHHICTGNAIRIELMNINNRASYI